MRPDKRFLNLPKHFWANVRLISQEIGYTVRGTGQIKIPTRDEIKAAYGKLSLESGHLLNARGKPTKFGSRLLEYFRYRSDVLESYVRPLLMSSSDAKALFEKLFKKLRPTCPIPMNKQRGDKKAPAFFTGIINMLIESNAGGCSCDYDPRVLTTITKARRPLRTLARRVDGAFPSALDPVAVWEIKEYYYTTTFGSRVADGVYETLLDGMEIEELAVKEGTDVKHYLMVDAYYTWWDCGRSYLCRIVDMLHMGYVDEVLFGCEVTDRLPQLVQEWVAIVNERNGR
mgnify:CR=1 FL=1